MGYTKEQRIKNLQEEARRLASEPRGEEEIQQKPKATGASYKDFDVFLCNIEQVQGMHKGNPVWFMSKARVIEKVFTRKVEPHLVYGSKKWNSVGFNDQILLDLKIPVQVWFPKDTVKAGDILPCGNIFINVRIQQGGKNDVVAERRFNFFTYEGSKTLKEMAADCRNEYEFVMPEQL